MKRLAALGLTKVIALSGLTVSAQTNVFPSSGNVGIGTNSPGNSLSIVTSRQQDGIAISTAGTNQPAYYVIDTVNHTAGVSRLAGGSSQLYQLGGGVGGGAWLAEVDLGTDIVGNGNNAKLRLTTSSAFFQNGSVGIGTAAPSSALEVNGNVKLTAGSGAALTFADGTSQTTAWTGVVCGGDYAESVDVSGDRKSFSPGDVIVIDPKEPGKFLKSAEPYSTSVSGIYSTKPGTVGRRQKTPYRTDEVPMAMMGIVPVKATTENGLIHPGDLLVTSSKVGYAMKGSDRNLMLGAVIGKALGNLESAEGVVEVVVTLQ